ncbi:TRM11 family SAM-dependent methyltransferase [Neobacillus bataviensis]|uniref:TRM11 family SAM-dependent methyltransferase n=1 Tax=Neobacillus bataviensis TaxID=220685 RepID=UPI001CBB1943|nr:RNA methyltransferase [Neobacillus bataviensis]
MDITPQKGTTYIYTYAHYEDERSLCALEMRSLFSQDSDSNVLESSVKIDPSRSPFIKERITAMYEAENLEDLLKQVGSFQLRGATFKVTYVKNNGQVKSEQESFEKRRAIEREIGLHINGTADLRNPDQLLGIMNINGRWIFGEYVKSESVWFRHQQKPNDYSTALSTRVARAVVNIAIPNPIGVTAIDPCCGIGTVLVEARSMGIDIVGSDRNPLILPGARENLAHFGLSAEINRADIRDINDHYDVAIIDLPYNLCSVINPEEQLEMLQSARRFSNKVVVVTVEPIDEILLTAGFTIKDRAFVKKQSFIREVIVCN